MKSRILSSLLLAAVLSCVLLSAGCGGGTASPAETTAAAQTQAADTTAADTAEVTEEDVTLKNGVPAGMDLNGEEIRVLYTSHNRYVTDIIGDQDGDIINEAVYARNLEVEEWLNIHFAPVTYGSNSTTESTNTLEKTVLAGEDLFDICSLHQSYSLKLVLNGYYHNFADDPYITYESPWWLKDYILEFGVGNDNIFFLEGDISLMMLKSMGGVFFNKGLYESLIGSCDDLYAEVLDGGWVFDTFAENVKKGWADLNGNSTVDVDEDRFGAAVITAKTVEHFQYDAGITSTTKDADGIPRLTLNNERTVRFAEKLYALYYENEGTYTSTQDLLDNTYLDMFKQDRLLFDPSWLYTAELLRDMESDYGILPYPKLDEQQDRYLNLVHNGTTVFCTPITCTKTDHIGAVLEAMCCTAYDTMTPAYFEVALKNKYSRDNASSQVLDLIRAGIYTNFGYCYSSNINGLGMLRDLMNKKTADFSSWYASKADAAQTGLDALITAYTEAFN